MGQFRSQDDHCNGDYKVIMKFESRDNNPSINTSISFMHLKSNENEIPNQAISQDANTTTLKNQHISFVNNMTRTCNLMVTTMKTVQLLYGSYKYQHESM